VDESGRVIGRHLGHWRYTVGQRRGLGVSAGGPWFVLRVDAARNEVVAGPRAALMRRSLVLRDAVDRGLGDGVGLLVQLRYRSPAVAVKALQRQPGGRLSVRLARGFAGVAPGQSAVFYRDDVVVGGGVVDGGL